MEPKSEDEKWHGIVFYTGWTPAKLKRILWGNSRVKHDPADKDSKDWDESEPDPKAP